MKLRQATCQWYFRSALDAMHEEMHFNRWNRRWPPPTTTRHPNPNIQMYGGLFHDPVPK